MTKKQLTDILNAMLPHHDNDEVMVRLSNPSMGGCIMTGLSDSVDIGIDWERGLIMLKPMKKCYSENVTCVIENK